MSLWWARQGRGLRSYTGLDSMGLPQGAATAASQFSELENGSHARPPTHPPTHPRDSPPVLPRAGGTGHPLPCPECPRMGPPRNSRARGSAGHLGWCLGSGWSQLSQRSPELLHHLRVCTSLCAAQNPCSALLWGGRTSEVCQHLCWGSGEGQLRAGLLWVGCSGSLRREEGSTEVQGDAPRLAQVVPPLPSPPLLGPLRFPWDAARDEDVGTEIIMVTSCPFASPC